MAEQELIKQLKAAKTAYDKKFAPTPEDVERIRGLLMARIDRSEVRPISVSKIEFILGFLRYITPPQLAYGMGIFVLFIGSAVFAAYAREALPGQSLYGAKIALEKTHVRFVSNPAERARVQMDLAGRRLDEASAMNSVEQEAKVLRQFSQDVKEAKNTLKQAADPLQVEAAYAEFIKKAKEYEEKLNAAKLRKPNREVGFAAIAEAEQALKDVQAPAPISAAPELQSGEVDNTQNDEQAGMVQVQSAVEELQDGEVSL